MRAGPLAAAVALILVTAAPAAAAPSPDPLEPNGGAGGAIQLSGVSTLPSQVEFFLHPDGFDGPADLENSGVTVTAGGTQLPSTVSEIPESASDPNRAVVLVLQLGGSGLETARAAVARYAVAAPDGVALGLVTLAAHPTNVLSPTTDRNDFLAALKQVGVAESTDLPGAVSQADAMLVSGAGADQYRSRRVLVVSSRDTAVVASAQTVGARMAAGGRTVDAVTVGPATESVVRLVSAGGGRISTAASADGLRAALDDQADALAGAVLVRARVPYELSGRTTDLQAAAGGLTTTERVALDVDPNAIASAPDTVAVPGGTAWSLLIGLAAISALLVWFAVRVLTPALADSEGRRALARLQRILEHPRGGKRRSRFSVVTLSGHAATAAGYLLRNPARRAKIELSLERAGSSMTPDQWVALRIALTIGLVVVGMLAFGGLPGLILGVVVGAFGTGGWLRFRAGRRAKAFAEQLPDSLRIVVGSLRSGFSLHQAIDSVASEGDGPVATEFRRALAEIRLGGNLEEALERVAERNNSRDVLWLVMALRIQSDVGGSLAEVVETTVETMRERGRLERHVRALSAEGRMSAYVLLALPIGVGGFMFAVRRAYVKPLYTTSIGIGLLVGAIVFMILGAVWLRKLVKVEV
ncbi:type II secretion system F family protein [Cryptosporangium phraense]|uniref:VWA domain-containing protein n=1 Tax=Cryptosporangium phraense TaxID=2593070 RepID=A0A545AHI4_9ACTN|nr:type II secretion system F family protein [Cryptosporangium phraense]TQS40720.1 VWA domain-containing protein [Cryptosporangium phraense]